jgi:adenylate kinase
MIISLTGTPGTGKTSISKLLNKNNIDIIHLNNVIAKHKSIFKMDHKRKTKIVDIDKLNKIIGEIINKNNLIIIEGHFSHLLKYIDKVIVLRCHPSELKIRLNNKNWNKYKIKENIEAEILDIILCECISKYSKNNIFEINTTGMKINEISLNIIDMINNNFTNNQDYYVGKIDWSNEIFNIEII